MQMQYVNMINDKYRNDMSIMMHHVIVRAYSTSDTYAKVLHVRHMTYLTIHSFISFDENKDINL